MSRPKTALFGVDVQRFVCPHCQHSLVCLVGSDYPAHIDGTKAGHEFIHVSCRPTCDYVRDHVEYPVKFLMRRECLEDAYRRQRDERS